MHLKFISSKKPTNLIEGTEKKEEKKRKRKEKKIVPNKEDTLQTKTESANPRPRVSI